MAVVTDIAKGALADRIRELMETHGLSKAELSKETGIPSATIGYIVDGSTYNPRIATLLTIGNYFKVTLDYMVGSQCEKSMKNIGKGQEVKAPAIADGESKQVPLLEWKEVKYWIKHRFQYLKNSEPTWIPSNQEVSEDAFALIIPHQTQGIFPRKSMILADPNAEYSSSDYVLASVRGGNPTIKKVFKEHEKLYLNSVGINLNSEEITEENKVLAKIVESRIYFKNGK